MSTVLTAEPVHLGSLALPGDLVVPVPALGLVVLAQGCSRDRLSTRNQWVARAVQRTRMATLLFDLLTDEEACDRHRVSTWTCWRSACLRPSTGRSTTRNWPI
jgi:putative phosphoribosyl transferase